ncbi:MAG: glycerol acyltransferase [Bacteroidetes bacterium]|nr:MAG: glycerol acyltransferase [Bacteroidota bacterium]
MKWIATFLLRLAGWRITHGMPEGISKAVIIMAPHTSNWDFVIGRLGFVTRGVKPKTIIKKESFFFPLGIILKALGAIPMDRGFSAGTIKKVTALIDKSDEFFLIITPEGTRKLVRSWKKGFYFLAEQANVPIIMGFLDYRTKTGGMGPVIYPSGNYEEDLKKIEEFYKDKQAFYPENFNLSPENLKKRETRQ